MRISDWSSDVCSTNLFWHETYGGSGVQPLTLASLETLLSPDPEFSRHSFLSPRTALTIGQASEAAAVDAFVAECQAKGVDVERWSGAPGAAKIQNGRASCRESVCQ